VFFPAPRQNCPSDLPGRAAKNLQKVRIDVNLILLEEHELDAAGEATLTDGRAAHLRQVLAAQPGSAVRVGLLDGPMGTGLVTSVAPPAVTLRCTFESAAPSRPGVDLLLALPRPKVLRRLWAQLSALGVGQIILTNAGRVERNYFDTHVLAPGCYRSLLIEGLQQARDTRLPAVTVHRQFRPLIEDHLGGLFPEGTRLVADHRASTPIGNGIDDPARRVLLAVGPEGGWNEFELTLLERHGFQPVSMGPRTLRIDTACIALLGVVHEALRSQPGWPR
jgi:RsmE family RNA methyltransferase